MINCDWCGQRMRRIGAVETGMLVGHASVWLCWCGHEREVSDSMLPLWWWRDELVHALFCRYVDELLRLQDERLRGIRAQHEAAMRLAHRILSSDDHTGSRAASTSD